MGTDKALLEVDGQPMAVRVAEAMGAAGAARVIAVGGDAAELRAAGLEVVPDRWRGAGPLGGIVTALEAADAPITLVAGCDLVQPTPAAMRAVVEALAADPSVDVAVAVTERPQWAHAAWRARAIGPLREALDRGERAVHRAASALAIAQVRGIDPLATRDADTPEQFASLVIPSSSVAGMKVPEIDVDELARVHASGAPIIDVREEHEFEAAHIPGVVHIPLGEVVARTDEVPREGTVYVVCGHGPRSARAVQHYRAKGIDAVNVAGGTVGWIEAGHPTASGPDA